MNTIKTPVKVAIGTSHFYIYDGDGQWVFKSAGFDECALSKTKELARVINSHDALVESVKSLKLALVAEMNNPGLRPNFTIIALAESALKLAEGQP